MLENTREFFRNNANKIDNWEKLSKNDLCYQYLENVNNKEIQEACFSALVYKYWPLISKYYYKCSNVATMEDCYDWLINSITYALTHARWNDPDSSIYKDPNGPDKVINRYMKCSRLTYYQFINRKKRKDNFGILSLDELLNMSNNSSNTNTIYNLIESSNNNNTLDLDLNLDLHKYICSVGDTTLQNKILRNNFHKYNIKVMEQFELPS